jgi:tRNA wybutosine-synthesizing protein 3
LILSGDERLYVDQRHWRFFKKRFWNRLLEDLEIGYLDNDLLPLLLRLNSDRNIYTLSSCSGRVVLSDSTYPWSREETSVVFKKHDTVSVDEIRSVVEKPVVRRLWINVNGPIIHVSVLKPKYVRLLLKIARNAGLKHSGILSINKYKGYILELMSGVKFTHLLKIDDMVFDGGSLEKLVDIVNKIYLEGRKTLDRLAKIVYDEIPLEEDEEIINDIRGRDLMRYFTSYEL